MKKEIRIALIGAGRTGTAIAFHLSKSGYTISAVSDRSRAKAAQCYERLGMKPRFYKPAQAVERSNFIIIATWDREIEAVYHRIYDAVKRGDIIVHVSGAMSSQVFNGIEKKKAYKASLHPIQTFSEIENAIRSLPGSYFSVEGDRYALPIVKKMVKDMGCTPVTISRHKKYLYHVMCVLTSNYLVTLLATAVALGEKLGFKEKKTREILNPLIRQTLKSMDEMGVSASLTGPIERGDVDTVKLHLSALKKFCPELLKTYIALAESTVHMAMKTKMITKKGRHNFMRLLKNYEKPCGR